MRIKTAGGERKLAISRDEWEAIGRKAGWRAAAIDDDRLKQLSSQLALLKDQGPLELVFDNDDEFWILKDRKPVWRSSDYHVDDTVREWNSRVDEGKIDREWVEARMEDPGKLPGYRYAPDHPLDRKAEVFHGLEGPENNYFRRVWACLSNIVAEVEEVSEKAVADSEQIHERVDGFLRDPAVMNIVEMSAKGGRRPEFCAEKLFAAAGNALNRQAMDTSRDEAVRAVLYAQETADDAILKLLKAGEATMPEDLKAAWHQLGDGFGHVLKFL